MWLTVDTIPTTDIIMFVIPTGTGPGAIGPYVFCRVGRWRWGGGGGGGVGGWGGGGGVGGGALLGRGGVDCIDHLEIRITTSII